MCYEKNTDMYSNYQNQCIMEEELQYIDKINYQV